VVVKLETTKNEEQHSPDSYDQTQRLFAYGEIKANGKTFAVVTSSEIKEKLPLTKRQTVQLLTRLAKAARIQRLQRKLNLIPGRLPPGKTWKPSAYEVLPCYMNYLKAKCQVTGITALAHHGFSTQIVQKIALYNNVLSGERKIAGSTKENGNNVLIKQFSYQ
jgi:predicted transcriptional regulator of viral defense system